jgi:hypothetical protein
MEFNEVVKVLESLNPEDFETHLFLDLMAGNLCQGAAKSFIIYKNDTAPDWLRAYANSSNKEFGKHEAIITFLISKGGQGEHINDVSNQSEIAN